MCVFNRFILGLVALYEHFYRFGMKAACWVQIQPSRLCLKNSDFVCVIEIQDFDFSTPQTLEERVRCQYAALNGKVFNFSDT